MDPLEKVRADAESAKLGLRDVAGGRRERLCLGLRDVAAGAESAYA